MAADDLQEFGILFADDILYIRTFLELFPRNALCYFVTFSIRSLSA